MNFKVSSSVKGALIIKGVKTPLKAGMVISLNETQTYSDEAQSLIRRQILTPEREEDLKILNEEVVDRTNKIIVINKTDRTVVVGGVSISPHGSLFKDRESFDLNSLRGALKQGLIEVVADRKEEDFKIEGINNDDEEELFEEEIDETPIEEEEDLFDEDEIAEETKPQVWDFRQQKTVDAEKIETSKTKFIDEEVEEDENIFIDKDKEDEADFINDEKEDTVELINVNEKKKEKPKTKRKPKIVKPIGERKREKTQADAAVELKGDGDLFGMQDLGKGLENILDNLEI